MGKVKTENATFVTQKTANEIKQILRELADDFGAEVEKITDDDPLSSPAENEVLAILLSGRVGLFSGMKHFRPGGYYDLWGVQVYVFENGVDREIETIAIGERNLSGAKGAFNFGASKERMEKIINALR